MAEASEPVDSLVLQLEGFEGPLDLLLDLARAQKVDLAGISILALVDQYLAVIEGARRVRLELAADWLVMAAWLTWLKSRLVLPVEPGSDDTEGVDAAEALAARLRDLESVRAAAAWLAARPLLGRDIFVRGASEDHTVVDRSRLAADLPGLVRAYLGAIRRGSKPAPYRPKPLTLFTVQDALRRLRALIGDVVEWTELVQFLPADFQQPTERRAAVASTLMASLELARDGAIALRQEDHFGPIRMRRRPPGGVAGDDSHE
jgi:segregation and condensation protein A